MNILPNFLRYAFHLRHIRRHIFDIKRHFKTRKAFLKKHKHLKIWVKTAFLIGLQACVVTACMCVCDEERKEIEIDTERKYVCV